MLSIVCFLQGCVPAAIGENQALVSERLRDNPDIEATIITSGDFELHYRSAGSPRELQLFWIHGTPGAWTDIGGLMIDRDFVDRARLISIDRPGWGQSQNHGQQRAAGTFEEHARLLKPLLTRLRQEHPDVPLITAGYSWGSPLAAYLGARYPGLIDGVMALAGPFDPSLEILRWYNHVGRLPLIRYLIGDTLRRSNTEMFLLPGEVRAAQTVWPDLRSPLLIIHGEQDALVPVAHADYAARLFAGTRTHVLKLEDQGHLLPFERPELIGRCALALANQDLAPCLER